MLYADRLVLTPFTNVSSQGLDGKLYFISIGNIWAPSDSLNQIADVNISILIKGSSIG